MGNIIRPEVASWQGIPEQPDEPPKEQVSISHEVVTRLRAHLASCRRVVAVEAVPPAQERRFNILVDGYLHTAQDAAGGLELINKFLASTSDDWHKTPLQYRAMIQVISELFK